MESITIEEFFRQYSIWDPETRAKILHDFYEWWDKNREYALISLGSGVQDDGTLTAIFFSLYLAIFKAVQETNSDE